MIPDECASIRSMARWVFPVLVGPSTAVTPAPRVRASRSAGGENEMGIEDPAFRAPGWPANEAGQGEDACLCITTRRSKDLCLRCGTSLERIAAESLTRVVFDFVHRDIWMRRCCRVPHRVSKAEFSRPPWCRDVNVSRERRFSGSQEAASCG